MLRNIFGVIIGTIIPIYDEKTMMERAHCCVLENSRIGELSEECSKYGEID